MVSCNNIYQHHYKNGFRETSRIAVIGRISQWKNRKVLYALSLSGLEKCTAVKHLWSPVRLYLSGLGWSGSISFLQNTELLFAQCVDSWNLCGNVTCPLGLTTPGHRGFLGSNSGIFSSDASSIWPHQGRFILCGDTRTHSPFKGLYRVCACSK